MHRSAAIWQMSPASPPFEAFFQRRCVLANANSGETPLLLAQETPAHFAVLEKKVESPVSRRIRDRRLDGTHVIPDFAPEPEPDGPVVRHGAEGFAVDCTGHAIDRRFVSFEIEDFDPVFDIP